MPVIEQKARAYASQASTHGLQLANDDPFELLVTPNGSWSLICLDLLGAKPNILNDPEERAVMRGYNERSVEEFVYHLGVARDLLGESGVEAAAPVPLLIRK